MKKKKKLTPANLCYSSRHKRDNYWCGGRRTERRTKSDSRGESRGRCVNFGMTAEHAVVLVIDMQINKTKKNHKREKGHMQSCKHRWTHPCKRGAKNNINIPVCCSAVG